MAGEKPPLPTLAIEPGRKRRQYNTLRQTETIETIEPSQRHPNVQG